MGGAATTIPPEPHVPPERLAAEFKRQTGDQLVRRGSGDLRHLGLGIIQHWTVAECLKSKYGDFIFSVWLAPPTDPSLADPFPPSNKEVLDEESVSWREDFDERSPEMRSWWVACKWNGNVKLTWFTDERFLDERWRVLDRVLRSL